MFVLWGTNDGARVWGSWATATRLAGSSTGAHSYAASLVQNKTYYYRFAATNAAGTNWAYPTAKFITGAVWVDKASDAAETGLVPGTFTVHRASAATNVATTVNYTIGGTASNGTDHTALSGQVTIPVGAATAKVVVTPKADFDLGAETVQITLAAGSYPIGSPASATMTIADKKPLYVSKFGSHTAPYTNWVMAATNIQVAINYASNNLALYDTVVITNGAYPIAAQINVNSAIGVIGFGGAANTKIYRSAGTTRVLAVNNVGAVVDSLTISNGFMNLDGAGVSLANGTLRRCVIRNNNGSGAIGGGGVKMSGGTLSECTVFKNDAYNGGAINMSAGALDRCTIANNTGFNAGGIYISGGTVQNCVITNNTGSGIEGAGVYISSGTSVLRNCLVARNSGTKAAGVYMSAASGSIQNCTVVSNVNGSVTGGIWMNNGTVANTIVYYNKGTTSNNVYKSGGTMTYSCTTPLVTGTSNMDASGNPRFVDRWSQNYQLTSLSPCIDAGQTLAAVTNDLLGVSRPRDGDNNGSSAHDMGAYEYVYVPAFVPLGCDISLTPAQGVATQRVVFTALPSGSVQTGLFYKWDFNNDSVWDATGAGKRIVTNGYGVGRHTVKLTVTNSTSELATTTSTNCVYVAPPVVYVAENGTREFPYDTWAKATTNLQAAVDAALVVGTNRSSVLITNGSYGTTGTVLVDKGIVVSSVNGATNTTVRRVGASSFTVIRLQHASAVLDGLSVTNGNQTDANYGGGVHVDNGTVRRCIISRNYAYEGGGLRLAAGLAENCQIIRNTGFNGAGARLSGGTLCNSTVSDNTGGGNEAGGVYLAASGAAARNCLITRNVTSARGAGVYMVTGATVENCTVVTNTTSHSSGGGGIYMTGGTVANSIVYYNIKTVAGVPEANNVAKSGGVFTYSCSTPLISGGSDVNNIDATGDPKFVAAAAGDYRLKGVSPCIDVGQTLAVVTNDLLGVSRPQDGDNNGTSSYDMGAYEYEYVSSATPLSCDFSYVPAQGISSQNVAFTALVLGSDQTNLVYYWDFDHNGTWDLSGGGRRVVTNQYGIGRYTVALKVTNAGGEAATNIQANIVYVAPPVVYVATNGTHTFPYETWAKAATNVQSAVDAALVVGANRSSVLVTNGSYATASQILIAKGIVVQSVNGAFKTTVRRQSGTSFGVFKLQDAAAVLDGFSITNGVGDPSNGGGVTIANGGTLRRCVVTRNNSYNGGGIAMSAGVIDTCQITDNTAFNAGGLMLSGGTVSNSVIARNVGTGNTGGGVHMGNATLRNCLVYLNSGVQLGGGVYADGAGSAIESCTIVTNSALGAYPTGGGLYVSLGSAINTIVYRNRGAGGVADNVRTNDIGRCTYSCAPELANVANQNLTGDPLFVNAPAMNFRLREAALCANRGSTKAWMLAALDLDGNPRVVGGTVDMGCYESGAIRGTLFLMR